MPSACSPLSSRLNVANRVHMQTVLLHFAAMFIHHVFITGCADRGAWPWRKPAVMTA